MVASLRSLFPADAKVEAVRVRAIKDLFWSDGKKQHLHVKAGEQGTLIARTPVGFLVRFDSEKVRQVLDFQGAAKDFKAEDEIALL